MLWPVTTASASGLPAGGDRPAMLRFCFALRVRRRRSCFLGGSFSPLYLPDWPGRSRLIRSGFLVPGFGGDRSLYFFLGLTSLLPPLSRRVSSGFWRSLGGGKSSKSSSVNWKFL